MFCKPKHLQATQHLFVGNCGTALGLSAVVVSSYFKSLGACDVHVPDQASHSYASFSSTAAAEEAVRALSGRPIPELGNRILKVRFSDLKEEKVRCSLAFRGCNANPLSTKHAC